METETRKMRIMTFELNKCLEQEDYFGWYPLSIQSEDDESIVTFQRKCSAEALDKVKTLEAKYYKSNQCIYYDALCVRHRMGKADDAAARRARIICGCIGAFVLFMMLCNGSIFEYGGFAVISCIVLYFAMRLWYCMHSPSMPDYYGTNPITEEEKSALLNEAYQLTH